MRLTSALKDLDAYYRGRGEQRLRPVLDYLASSGHQLLMTRFGPLDLLGTIGAGRSYEDLLGRTVEMRISGLQLRVLSLDALIEIKEETGHDKDRAMLPVLRRTLEEKLKS